MHSLKPEKKRSRAVFVIIAMWLGLLGLLFWNMFGPPSTAVLAEKPVYHTELETAEGALGNDRRTELHAATQAYLKAHPDAPEAMAQGKQYAPVEFLNDQLAAKGAKWRVRSTDGLTVKTYTVS
jgi:hypothetical protein